jgi:hypothetical protein
LAREDGNRPFIRLALAPLGFSPRDTKVRQKMEGSIAPFIIISHRLHHPLTFLSLNSRSTIQVPKTRRLPPHTFQQHKTFPLLVKTERSIGATGTAPHCFHPHHFRHHTAAAHPPTLPALSMTADARRIGLRQRGKQPASHQNTTR